ncbi:MAG: hypothetical protein IJW82_00965, partial [Clostridia bacterium]|nr:hypothetical protein [Clostridia bacterium]
ATNLSYGEISGGSLYVDGIKVETTNGAYVINAHVDDTLTVSEEKLIFTNNTYTNSDYMTANNILKEITIQSGANEGYAFAGYSFVESNQYLTSADLSDIEQVSEIYARFFKKFRVTVEESLYGRSTLSANEVIFDNVIPVVITNEIFEGYRITGFNIYDYSTGSKQQIASSMYSVDAMSDLEEYKTLSISNVKTDIMVVFSYTSISYTITTKLNVTLQSFSGFTLSTSSSIFNYKDTMNAPYNDTVTVKVSDEITKLNDYIYDGYFYETFVKDGIEETQKFEVTATDGFLTFQFVVKGEEIIEIKLLIRVTLTNEPEYSSAYIMSSSKAVLYNKDLSEVTENVTQCYVYPESEIELGYDNADMLKKGLTFDSFYINNNAVSQNIFVITQPTDITAKCIQATQNITFDTNIRFTTTGELVQASIVYEGDGYNLGIDRDTSFGTNSIITNLYYNDKVIITLPKLSELQKDLSKDYRFEGFYKVNGDYSEEISMTMLVEGEVYAYQVCDFEYQDDKALSISIEIRYSVRMRTVSSAGAVVSLYTLNLEEKDTEIWVTPGVDGVLNIVNECGEGTTFEYYYITKTVSGEVVEDTFIANVITDLQEPLTIKGIFTNSMVQVTVSYYGLGLEKSNLEKVFVDSTDIEMNTDYNQTDKGVSIETVVGMIYGYEFRLNSEVTITIPNTTEDYKLYGVYLSSEFKNDISNLDNCQNLLQGGNSFVYKMTKSIDFTILFSVKVTLDTNPKNTQDEVSGYFYTGEDSINEFISPTYTGEFITENYVVIGKEIDVRFIEKPNYVYARTLMGTSSVESTLNSGLTIESQDLGNGLNRVITQINEQRTYIVGQYLSREYLLFLEYGENAKVGLSLNSQDFMTQSQYEQFVLDGNKINISYRNDVVIYVLCDSGYEIDTDPSKTYATKVTQQEKFANFTYEEVTGGIIVMTLDGDIVDSDITIHIAFKLKEYKVNFVYDSSYATLGLISAVDSNQEDCIGLCRMEETSLTVHYGYTVNILIACKNDGNIVFIRVDNEIRPNSSIVTIVNVTKDVTVEIGIDIALQSHTVLIASNNYGSIDMTATETVAKGRKFTDSGNFYYDGESDFTGFYVKNTGSVVDNEVSGTTGEFAIDLLPNTNYQVGRLIYFIGSTYINLMEDLTAYQDILVLDTQNSKLIIKTVTANIKLYVVYKKAPSVVLNLQEYKDYNLTVDFMGEDGLWDYDQSNQTITLKTASYGQKITLPSVTIPSLKYMGYKNIVTLETFVELVILEEVNYIILLMEENSTKVHYIIEYINQDIPSEKNYFGT